MFRTAGGDQRKSLAGWGQGGYGSWGEIEARGLSPG